MGDYAELEAILEARLAELTARAEEVEDELRHPLDADSSEQAVDLSDDEALAGIDTVLRNEIAATRNALQRIADGTYGSCVSCGAEISEMRLKALPTAALCINCA